MQPVGDGSEPVRALNQTALLARGRECPAPNPSKEYGNLGMDFTWVTGRIAVGGGIWNADNMAVVARAGVTHIVDMQVEFDDTALAEPHEIQVLWNPIGDDFQPKAGDVFQRGVDFALEALDQPDTKLLIHCAAGVHRAPMMALAVLCSLSWKLDQAMELIAARRAAADFPEVYVRSVERFLEQRVLAATKRMGP
jgi:protein-tyrosine phosphatase